MSTFALRATSGFLGQPLSAVIAWGVTTHCVARPRRMPIKQVGEQRTKEPACCSCFSISEVMGTLLPDIATFIRTYDGIHVNSWANPVRNGYIYASAPAMLFDLGLMC